MGKYVVKGCPVQNNKVIYYENEIVELDSVKGSYLVGLGIVVEVPETITTSKTKKGKEEPKEEIEIQTNEEIK